ncbi:methyl jasmonate esterase 1-like [Andrographis paniculata]|uniref:methyl jasmonate esterase 1-like n=1 Tax=Andrographis paniculata TaxID=175694 RepID=UPI0021E7A44B|nr:methyl jasmonate esterase 1-like [Andrographis paniculata]
MQSRRDNNFPDMEMECAGKTNQSHFVLIHGAGHGAWCWYKVATSLRVDGHRVTALDMAASGADPKPLKDVSSLSDYCKPLINFLEALPFGEKVVLVGHSMGGFCLSLAMETFPEKIALAVFAAAFMPGPDLPASAVYAELPRHLDSYMDSEYSFDNGVENPPTSMVFGPEFLASRLYQLCPPQDLTLATLLLRPVGVLNQMDELALSRERYGSVRRAYVVCGSDLTLKQGFQEWQIERNPVDEVKFIAGADHMVMLSGCQELCSCLKDLVTKFS